MNKAFPLFLAVISTTLLADDGCRQGIIERAQKPKISKRFSPILGKDRASDLIDAPDKMVSSISKMADLNLQTGQSTKVPWSDSYWPLNKGGLGQRYTDDKVVFLDWKAGLDYVSANPAQALMEGGNWSILSPSEKYDFMMDLKDLPLTTSSWNEGRAYFEKYGKVESWMGLCHGWAAASIMMPEPAKKIEIPTINGVATLNPSDIKGLATLLWAKGDFETRFVGGRCHLKKPVVDSLGRPIVNDCLDNNPGTWHLAVVNQLGVSKRPFIMDATFDYEVWNQPVFAYEYSYFNPGTMKRTLNLQEAVVKTGEWDDSRLKVRAPKTDHIVGIIMTVSYVSENSPSVEENQPVRTTQVEYEYDLEMNQNGEIIGGEWYSKQHPDFLWVPVPGTFPETSGDTGDQPLNFENLSQEAKAHAELNASNGMPWGPVVRNLVEKSQN